jgi:hypothetical protein
MLRAAIAVRWSRKAQVTIKASGPSQNSNVDRRNQLHRERRIVTVGL